MLTLDGRTCVFAGAYGSDAAAAVHALCREGMNVAIMTNKPSARAFCEEVNANAYRGRCAVFTEGHGEKGVLNAAYEKVREIFGGIDVVICNKGGVERDGEIETATSEKMQTCVSDMVKGCFEMIQSALRYLRESSAPRIILMTSVDGCYGGRTEGLPLAVGHGAVRALTLNAAARLAGEGITVNCISKGIYETEFAPQIPLKRAAVQEDLAAAICFLASEESSYLTGQILEMNGGMHLGKH